MATTIPDVEGQSQQPVPQSGGGVAAYEPPNWRQVGMAGEAVARSGRDLEEASNMVAATNERQDGLIAQSASNQLAQQRITQEFDAKSGFRSVQGANAVGQQFVDTYSGKFNDAQTLIRDNLTNENQKRIFDQHAQVQGLQFKGALLNHQAQQTDKFNDQTEQDSLQLSLRQVATNADQDLTIGADGAIQDNNIPFKLQMAQIEGTIDNMAKRRGWLDDSGKPNAIAQLLKGKMTDAAYGTRIKAIMDGIPGAVQPNPYMAEKLFESVQSQLGDVSRIQLGEQVLKATKNVQQREWADYAVFGGKSRSLPSDMAPAVDGTPPLLGIVRSMESGGNMNAVSSKGAVSDMQVMGPTSADPGYGVRPAQPGPDGKISLEEMSRVGKDYLGAMTARYDNPALILAAYNAGPGRVDAWLSKFGDPRTGQISTQAWADKIPFPETQKYVQAGLQKANINPAQADTNVSAMSANQLKTQLMPIAQAGYQHWLSAYPNDIQGAEALRSRIISNGNMVVSNQQAIQANAHDGLVTGMTGTKPDGSDKPLSIDQLLSDPQQKQNWDQATPEVKQMVQHHFENPGLLYQSNPKMVNDLTQRIYLPDGDPQKITTPGQITEFMGKGLNYTDQQHLIKEMQTANTPEGNPFLKQVSQIKHTGTQMLKTSMSAVTLAHPDMAEEAAYRFGIDVDDKIKAARAAGKDPQTLFVPGSPDYVLSPNRVAAFMPTEAQIVASRTQPQAAPRIASDAEYAKLPSGSTFIGPDGKQRRKP